MPFLRKYGVGTGADIWVPIIKRAVQDFAVGADWTPVAGDVKITKDGGVAANITTLPVALAMGNGALWKFVFSDTELQAKVIVVTSVDAATKVIEDQAFIIETFGNASALYPPDFGDSVRLGLTALPNAAAEAAGGLFTRGVGAGQITQSANGQIDVNLERVRNAVVNALITGRLDANAQVLGTDVIDSVALATTGVNEIRDAILQATISELAQAQPPTTPQLQQAIMLLYMALRNASKSTATERRILNDAATVIAKATMSDDGTTFDQGKLVSGP